MRSIWMWGAIADNGVLFVLSDGKARILDRYDAERLGLMVDRSNLATTRWPSEAEQLAMRV